MYVNIIKFKSILHMVEKGVALWTLIIVYFLHKFYNKTVWRNIIFAAIIENVKFCILYGSVFFHAKLRAEW